MAAWDNTCTKLKDLNMERVKYYMHKITENTFAGTKTGDVLDDVLSSSGKMIRPRLLLLCSGYGPDHGERYDRLCLLAAMVELTHMASLVHDDIIDEAPFRRGVASIQSKYGKDAAVYAGDFLIERVHYWQLRENLTEAGMILSKTVEAMCIGEIGQAACRYDLHVTSDDYMKNITGKTAALFGTACELGAIESGCDRETIQKLRDFGVYLGIIFQLRDDLLDFISSNEIEGKELHKDFHDGIYTFPVLMALEMKEGREKILPIMQENRKRKLTSAEIHEMEQYTAEYGGIVRTKEYIHMYADHARRILDSLDSVPQSQIIRKVVNKLENV